MERIKSLDGIRGLSIILVVLGHSYFSFTSGSLKAFLDKFFIHHHVGVSLFFVLSGYLITTILKKEEEKTGEVSFKKFFYKRVIRIFPAYYFYIFCIYVYNYISNLGIRSEDFIGALLYTGWYFPIENNAHFFGHFWSLSVEEHFYFIFPFVFIASKKYRPHILLALVLIAPGVRVLNYLLLPAYKAKMGYLSHTRYDMILWGCLLAEVSSYKYVHRVKEFFSCKVKYFIPFFTLLIVNPVLKVMLGAKYKYLIGYTVDGISISLIILLILDKSIKYNKFFEYNWLVKIGVYSYSIYIWQQMFTLRIDSPLSILYTGIAAFISYNLIEKNFLKFRKYI